MKTKQRNLALVLCSFIMAIALVFGVATFNTTAYASDTSVSIVMENGARIRLETENPGLIYTAKIANYDADLEYGMILVDNAELTAKGISANYMSALDTAEVAYQKIVCTPYGDEDKKITAHFDVARDCLYVQYAAIAYATDGETVTYSALTENNVRSVEYVAQKSYLWGDGDQTVLESFISAQIDAEYGINSDLPSKDAVLTNDNTYISIVPDLLNQADADRDPVGTDGTTSLSFMSKKAYEAGSTITMDIFVPEEYGRLNEQGNRTNWVAIGWSTSRTEGLDLYSFATTGNGKAIGDLLTAGEWTTVSVDLPSDDPSLKYYFWVSADKGAWHTEDGTKYALSIDNVSIVQPAGEAVEEDFEKGVANSIFAVKGNADKGINPSDVVYDVWKSGSIEIGAPAAEQSLKYTFNVSGETAGFVTKGAYAGGSTVRFKYFLPELGSSRWWGVAWTTSAGDVSIYSGADASTSHKLPESPVTGAWIDVEFTLPAGGPYYLYLGSECGNWRLPDGSDAYVLIDDFSVTTDGVTVTDDFNMGVDAKLFDVLVADSVSVGEGYVEPVIDGERAAKYIFNVNGETVSFTSKQAYASGSKVEFKYYIPEGTTTSWWRVAFDTVKDMDYYDTQYVDLSKATGAWIDFSYTLPAGGPYYLAITSECGGAHGRWMLDGQNAYALIDEFRITIGETVVYEDFNKKLEDSIFDVTYPGGVTISEDGEGYMPFKGDTMLAFNGLAIGGHENIAMITATPYQGITQISFQAMWTGDCTSSRWGISYTTDPTRFAYDSGTMGTDYINCYSPRLGELYQTAGVWYDYVITISGGEYTVTAQKVGEDDSSTVATGNYTDGANYLYFMICPTVSGEGVAFYLENFAIAMGEEVVTDTFDDLKSTLFVESATLNADHGSAGMGFELADVHGEPEVSGELGAKLTIDLISATPSTPSFITSSAYTSDGTLTVSFDYFMSGNANSKWWTLGWTTSNTNANIYAGVSADNTTETNSAQALPTDVQDEWKSASVTIPAGTWYFYFAGAVGEWGEGYVIIDNFEIGDIVTETFNNGEYGIFLDNRSSKPDAITIADGYVRVTGEFGAKIILSKISSTASTPTFITKKAYTLTEDTTLTFDYYTNSECWMMVGWTNDYANASIYAHVGSEEEKKTNGGMNIPSDTKDQWVSATYTIPAGTWYFYFAGNKPDCSSNKNGCGSDCYIIVDNFILGDIVAEDFSVGIADSIFSVRASHADAIEQVAGKPKPFEPGEYSAKIMLDNIVEVGINGAATFITKNYYDMGTTISFKYFIGGVEDASGNWISLSVYDPDFASDADLYDDTVVYLTVSVGEWLEFSYTIETIYTGDEAWPGYFYIGANVTNWGGVGYILIDDVTITTAGGETFTDDFTNGLTAGLFNVNTMGAVSLGEGYGATTGDPDVDPDEPTDNPDEPTDEPEEPEEPEVIVPEVTFESLLADGTLHDYVNSDDRVHVLYDLDVDTTGIGYGSLALNVKFDYLSTGRAFALVLDAETFIYFDGETVTVYQAGVAGATMAIANGKVDLAIRADGTMLLGVDGGDYTVIGSVQIGDVKFVSLFGEGLVTITNLKITEYNRVPA